MWIFRPDIDSLLPHLAGHLVHHAVNYTISV